MCACMCVCARARAALDWSPSVSQAAGGLCRPPCLPTWRAPNSIPSSAGAGQFTQPLDAGDQACWNSTAGPSGPSPLPGHLWSTCCRIPVTLSFLAVASFPEFERDRCQEVHCTCSLSRWLASEEPKNSHACARNPRVWAGPGSTEGHSEMGGG